MHKQSIQITCEKRSPKWSRSSHYIYWNSQIHPMRCTNLSTPSPRRYRRLPQRMRVLWQLSQERQNEPISKRVLWVFFEWSIDKCTKMHRDKSVSDLPSISPLRHDRSPQAVRFLHQCAPLLEVHQYPLQFVKGKAICEDNGWVRHIQ